MDHLGRRGFTPLSFLHVLFQGLYPACRFLSVRPPFYKIYTYVYMSVCIYVWLYVYLYVHIHIFTPHHPRYIDRRYIYVAYTHI
jgi:hypothetical protein